MRLPTAYARVLRLMLVSSTFVIATSLQTAIAGNSSREEQSVTHDSRSANSEGDHVVASDTKRMATRWGLTEAEWAKYQDLMTNSPVGIWTPKLDPLTALGIDAQSPEEQKRYAELYVRLEHERFEREKRFIVQIVSAQARLYPQELPLMAQRKHAHHEITYGQRLVFVAPAACNDCGERIARLVERAKPANNVVDVFVTGLNDDDNTLRKWAAEQHIDAKMVVDGKITINHEQGQLKTLKIDATTLPATFVRSVSGDMSFLP